MEWEKPQLTSIDMNAEIGSYQADVEDDPVRVPHPTQKPKAEAASALTQNLSAE